MPSRQQALTQLDLTVEVRPCPKDARTHRAQVQTLGGKQSFPFSSTRTRACPCTRAKTSSGTSPIGAGAAVPRGSSPTTALTGWMPTLFRAGRGMTRYPTAVSFEGKRPLTLYNYEGNQFARLVREALCSWRYRTRCTTAGRGARGGIRFGTWRRGRRCRTWRIRTRGSRWERATPSWRICSRRTGQDGGGVDGRAADVRHRRLVCPTFSYSLVPTFPTIVLDG